MTAEILRYAAFTDAPEGGNPAGVVLDASGLGDAEMQRIAADVGYSETAFVTRADGDALDVRYFSPLAEVPFCGHATIATGVAWSERFGPGTLELTTRSGLVRLEVSDGEAALVSVEPRVEPLDDLEELLASLRWSADDLDEALPPRVAYAGAWHPVIAASSLDRLAGLEYDFERLGALMAAREWTTIQLVHRLGEREFRARNPFPPGGVVEDPATGAAAAAFGGYLRELGLVDVPASVVIRQGIEIGRPSVLRVDIGERGGIRVSGGAVPIRDT
jgi:PhzF family phenazine biosynthesis protein